MTSGLYKYGRAQARAKLAIDTTTMREGFEALLGRARDAAAPAIAKGKQVAETGGKMVDQLRADPRVLENITKMEALARGGLEHAADRVVNPLTGGSLLASAALPGMAGAGIGALAAGEDARAEGALAGAGLGAAGGLAGMGLGRLAGGGARRKALGDIMESVSGAAQRGLTAKPSEGTLAEIAEAASKQAPGPGVPTVEQALEAAKPSAEDVLLAANLPATGLDVGSGLIRSKGIDLLSKGMGTAAGGGMGVAAGGLAGKALGDRARKSKEDSQRMKDRQADAGLSPLPAAAAHGGDLSNLADLYALSAV